MWFLLFKGVFTVDKLADSKRFPFLLDLSHKPKSINNRQHENCPLFRSYGFCGRRKESWVLFWDMSNHSKWTSRICVSSLFPERDNEEMT